MDETEEYKTFLVRCLIYVSKPKLNVSAYTPALMGTYPLAVQKR